MPPLPPVLMVFTGGTISMKIVPGRGAVPASSGREILDQVPQLAALARITCEDFDRLPGPHWSPERMFTLARHLDRRLDAGEFVGAVVTHGTDTLEETAYLLDLVMRTDRPVVLTGAMTTADDPAWDGPGNLIASVQTVTARHDRDAGVAVMMAGTLHGARQVAKSHTDAFDAFTSFGPKPQVRERIATNAVESRVELIAAYPGADARFLRHAVATGARGIVISAMGGGNVPPAMLSGRARSGGGGRGRRRRQPLRAWAHGAPLRLRGRRGHAPGGRRGLLGRSAGAEGAHQTHGALGRRGIRRQDPGIVRAAPRVSEPVALRYVKGIGPRRAEALAGAGIEHVQDLVEVFPFRWEDRRAFAKVSDLKPGGQEATLDLRVVSSRLIRTRRRGLTIFTAVLADATGSIKAVWYNQPYLERVLVTDARVVVFGRVTLDRYGRELTLDNPDYERLEADDEAGIHTGRIVPVYRKLGRLGVPELARGDARRSCGPARGRSRRPRPRRGSPSPGIGAAPRRAPRDALPAGRHVDGRPVAAPCAGATGLGVRGDLPRPAGLGREAAQRGARGRAARTTRSRTRCASSWRSCSRSS